MLQNDIIEWHGKNVSPREKDCLRYLFRGKTIKETAKLLNISNRTVEEYLDRVKRKVGCRYKRELIEIFQKERVERRSEIV